MLIRPSAKEVRVLVGLELIAQPKKPLNVAAFFMQIYLERYRKTGSGPG